MELAGSLALTVGLGLGGSRFFKWLRVTCTTNSEGEGRGEKGKEEEWGRGAGAADCGAAGCHWSC